VKTKIPVVSGVPIQEKEYVIPSTILATSTVSRPTSGPGRIVTVTPAEVSGWAISVGVNTEGGSIANS
jgi:hypothetical protein